MIKIDAPPNLGTGHPEGRIFLTRKNEWMAPQVCGIYDFSLAYVFFSLLLPPIKNNAQVFLFKIVYFL